MTDELGVALAELRRLKRLADGALAQVPPADLGAEVAPGTNPLGVLMKHVAGNQRSRWTDFLTTDGEKPDRNRDTEFELDAADTPEALGERWEAGWRRLFAVLEALTGDDLDRIVTIRGEPHTVRQAIARQLSHYAYHVGQIVLVARARAGDRWRTLSVAKGGSRAFNERPAPYFEDPPG